MLRTLDCCPNTIGQNSHRTHRPTQCWLSNSRRPGGSRSLQRARLPIGATSPPTHHRTMGERQTPAQKRPRSPDRGPNQRTWRDQQPGRSTSQADAPERLSQAKLMSFEPPAQRTRVQFEKPADQWNAFGSQKRGIRPPGTPLDAARCQQTPGQSPNGGKTERRRNDRGHHENNRRFMGHCLRVGRPHQTPHTRNHHATNSNAAHQHAPAAHTRTAHAG